MKSICCLIALLSLSSGFVRAATGPDHLPLPESVSIVAAVTVADEERMAATKAGERLRLEAIFSDGLRYAHSSGKIDSKASYIESLVSRQTVYESFEYKERTFTPAGPGIVLMSGRVLVNSRNNGQPLALDLNFLAVWREEGGRWRFLAWQSSRNPAPTPAK